MLGLWGGGGGEDARNARAMQGANSGSNNGKEPARAEQLHNAEKHCQDGHNKRTPTTVRQCWHTRSTAPQTPTE